MEVQIRAMEELIRGQECANKLKQKLVVGLQELSSDDESFEDLSQGMLKSFTNTLSLIILNSGSDQEVSQGLGVSSTGTGTGTGTGTDGSRSSVSQQTSSEDSSNLKQYHPTQQLSTFKRRKNKYSKYVDSPSWNIDCHAWRKYGQKDILKSKYPRNYFRCTHRDEQGCQATKQVQRIQDNPSLYRTTYFNEHTCRTLQNHPPHELVLDDLYAEGEENSKLLSFSNNNASTPTFSSFSAAKHQYFPPSTSNDHYVNPKPSSSPPNYNYVPSEMLDDGSLYYITEENFSPTNAPSLLDNHVTTVGHVELHEFCSSPAYYC